MKLDIQMFAEKEEESVEEKLAQEIVEKSL